MLNKNISEDQKVKIEEYLNNQLNLEYKAFYFYQSCMSYFDNGTVALKGLKRYYKNMSMEELTHAKGLIEYMNKCFLKIEFLSINIEYNFKGVNDILKKSIEFESMVYNHILNIYNYCESVGDRATTQFLDAYVAEQVDSIKNLNDLFVDYNNKIGLTIFDRSLLDEKE